MTHDLADIDERLRFADEQKVALAGDIEAWLIKNAILDVVECPLMTFTVHGRILEDPPKSFSIRSGQCIHEYRSILDSLACVLAVRNGRDPDDVYFPASGSAISFESDGLKKIKKLAPSDQEKIAALRPFRGGNDVLYGLHQLDLIRKHRRLVMQTAYGRPVFNDCYVTSAITHDATLTKNRKLIATIELGSGTFLLRRRMSFNEPETVCYGEGVIIHLNSCSNLVSQVVKLFR